jgi:two-component system cell cycle sensor histidine kinase/response regulator CckA
MTAARPPAGGLLRALVLSLAAASIPIAGVFLFPDAMQDYEALMWLLLLVPAFLWSYERGWSGIATALAFGMAALTTTYVIAEYRGMQIPDLLFAVVVLYVAITLSIGLFRERVAAAEADQATESLAMQDPLTTLPNRRHAQMHLQMEFAAAQRGRTVALVLFDVDRMKDYNARNGRAAGDGVLRGFASLLRQITRRMDLAARAGPDTFVSVLAGCPEEGAVIFAGRVQERLRAAESTVELPTVSAGIACFTPDMKMPDELWKAAEAALQQAKRDGRDRVRIYGRRLEDMRAPGSGAVQRVAAAAAADTADELVQAVQFDIVQAVAPARMGAGRNAFVLTRDDAVRARLVNFLRDEQFRVVESSSVGDTVVPIHLDFDIVFVDIAADTLAITGVIRELRQRAPMTRVVGVPRTDGGAVSPALLHVRVDAHFVPGADDSAVRQQIAELLAERDALMSTQLRNQQLANELRAKDRESRLALEATEAKYRMVVQSIQEVIFTTDVEGHWTFLNPAWTAVTGYNVEESLGQSMFQYVHAHEGGALHADFERAIEARTAYYRHEGRWRTRDGTYRWVELRLQLAFSPTGALDGTFGVLADVTERRHAEEALRQSAEYFRSLIENSADIMAVLDLDGRIRYVSPSIERVLGIPAEEWMGADALARVHPDDVETAEQVLSDVRTAPGITRSTDVRVRHGDGSWRLLEATVRNLADTPGVAGIVANARDATERQRAERTLRESEELLMRAQKMDAIGRLAGGVAHDFNNLLTAIQGHTDLLLGDLDSTSPLRADLQEIRTAAGRATALTRQLLAFSGRQVMQQRVLDVNDVVQDLETMLRRVIGTHIALHSKLAQEDACVRADPAQLEQVLLNLVLNARDAMPAGGKLIIETASVQLGPHDPVASEVPPGPYVLLRVRDTGTGMSPEVAASAFEPFFTTKATGKGTGLGLSAVYGVVKQSGGHVWLESARDEGTTVSVLLPRVAERAEPREERHEEHTEHATRAGGRETIMLVEDEQAVRELTRRILERAGYQVVVAANGREAFDQLRDSSVAIDLLLTDVVMPELNGQDLAERVRSSRPGTRVLFMSGYNEEVVLRQQPLAPRTAFLEKPFTPSLLLEHVRALLDDDK